ncbi:MAG: metalloregulator ArsR/SmtB family transcription factor [Archaeoglobaceae archaeon]
MVMNDPVEIFKALGDRTRFKILELLADGEKCVCEIVPETGRTQSTVSIQLNKLENLGILESRREGKSVYYRICNDKVKKVIKDFSE